MKRKTRKLSTLIAGLAVGVLLTPMLASATPLDTNTFDLGQGNSGLSSYIAGPYASVEVDLDTSTTATITFTGLTNAGDDFLFGGQGAVAVNVNASSWTLGSILGSNSLSSSFTPGPLTDSDSGNEDGWGNFNQTINSFDGYTHSSNTISFELTNTDIGGSWADAASVLTGNGSGYTAAAHIYVAGAGPSANAITTGYATNGPDAPAPAPEPASTLLFGTGLAGLALVIRKRWQGSLDDHPTMVTT